jgi:hypothetical protein
MNLLFKLCIIALPFSSATSVRRAKSSKQGKSPRKPATYFSVLSAAQEPNGCESTALRNAVATFFEDQLCVAVSYSGLSGPELFSHIHGPAPIGEENAVLFTLSTGTIKNDCFTLDHALERQLKKGLLYFRVHSEQCPGGEIRGQIFANVI